MKDGYYWIEQKCTKPYSQCLFRRLISPVGEIVEQITYKEGMWVTNTNGNYISAEAAKAAIEENLNRTLCGSPFPGWYQTPY